MSNYIDPNTATLDDFNYFWMDNGAPCFIANNWGVVDDICETIESFGFQIYYLICDKAVPKTVQQKNDKGVMTSVEIYEHSPAILKIVNNFTGRVVMDSPDFFGNNFASVEEVAQYNMPLIPKIIVDKLDEFFRLVDAQHKTESIVILTYDPTKEGPDGWGVLVPEQTNTSVHCKYDADSIAELKPDHVMIVGSVHSHPDMPAYASGTDHDDQADFDGVHITYGWQKSVNGGATQYHIELQIGGSNFTLKPEDVFESFTINKDPDPDVVEWASKVKKAQPLYTGGTATTLTHQTPPAQSYQTTWANQAHNSQHTPAGTQQVTATHSRFDKDKFLKDLGQIEPDAIVAFELDSRTNPESDCLICAFPLTEMDVRNGYCMTCDTPIITSDMGHFEILSTLHKYCKDRKLDPNVSYYIYCIDESNPLSNFLLNIKNNGIDPLSAGSNLEDHETSLAYDDDYNVTSEYTVCCNLHIQIADQCTCPKTVYQTDIALFDDAHRNVDVYDKNSKCLECAYYFDTDCPSFKEALVNFVTHDKVLTEQITECSCFLDYRNNQKQYSYVYERDYYYD